MTAVGTQPGGFVQCAVLRVAVFAAAVVSVVSRYGGTHGTGVADVSDRTSGPLVRLNFDHRTRRRISAHARGVATSERIGRKPARTDRRQPECRILHDIPLGEQQMLVFARVLLAQPAFALLDRPATAPGSDPLDRLLTQLTRHVLGYLVFAERDDRLDRYDAGLERMAEGKWRRQPVPGDAQGA